MAELSCSATVPSTDNRAALDTDALGSLSVVVKWNGGVYPVSVYDRMTVEEFKQAIQSQTNVKPDKQKIINLKCKGKCIKILLMEIEVQFLVLFYKRAHMSFCYFLFFNMLIGSI